MYFPILTIVQTGRFTSWKIDFSFWKLLILSLNFQDEGQLSANFLFYILITQDKCLAFQFLGLDIRIYFPILKGFKKGHFNS